MQDQSKIAMNLMRLFNPESYTEFSEGFFVKQPKMSGYYYNFKNMQSPKVCVIVNISSVKYLHPMTKIKDYIFIVVSALSFEDYINKFAEVYLPPILEVIDKAIERRSSRNLPYGYYMDENGDVKIDIRQASEVRKIYNMYIDTKSVRKIADKLGTNFSDIREILHDSQEYAQMPEKILPLSKIREVAELMAQNVRGGAVAKKDTRDEIAAAKRLGKELKRRRELN